MKPIAASLALTLLCVATATAGQYSSEYKRGPKQPAAVSAATTSVMDAPRIAARQTSAQLRGPKTKAPVKTNAKPEDTLAGKSGSTEVQSAQIRRFSGQHSDNGVGPKA